MATGLGKCRHVRIVVLGLLAMFFAEGMQSARAEVELSLVAEYAVPQWGTGIKAIAYDGTNIWTSQNQMGYSSRIYRHNMDATLSVADDFGSSSVYLTGMTFVDGALWTSDNMSNRTVRYAPGDPTTEIARYGQPGLSDGAHGIAYDGEAFWLCQAGNIAEVSYPSGDLLDSHVGLTTGGMGIEWDAERDCLWVLDDVSKTTILRQFTLSGGSLSQVGEFDLKPYLQSDSAGNFQAGGLTVADGYIWTCDMNGFKILKFALGDTTPESQIEALIELVEGMGLQGGLEHSLLAKLQGALSSLEDGNDTAATNQIQAFIHEVEAQTGKKISEEQADELLEAASPILAELDAPTEPILETELATVFRIDGPISSRTLRDIAKDAAIESAMEKLLLCVLDKTNVYVWFARAAIALDTCIEVGDPVTIMPGGENIRVPHDHDVVWCDFPPNAEPLTAVVYLDFTGESWTSEEEWALKPSEYTSDLVLEVFVHATVAVPYDSLPILERDDLRSLKVGYSYKIVPKVWFSAEAIRSELCPFESRVVRLKARAWYDVLTPHDALAWVDIME